MSGPVVRYPAGPITPAGAHHVLRNRIPMVALQSYDDSVVFNLMGGLAIHDQTMPERVSIIDLKGLIPPWQTIDQKGATEDGVTFVDALYDPIEVEMNVMVKGRDPAYTRKVYNHLIASIDAKQTSELSWITRDLGRWWSNVRWFKTMSDPVGGIATNRQQVSLRLRADDGFWRSYDNVDDFTFSYEDMSDSFDVNDTDGLDTGWTIVYVGGGTSHVKVLNSQAVWVKAGTTQRTMIARKDSFVSDTDNQVVTMELGSMQDWHFEDLAFNDLWARMASIGTAGQNGVRLRVGTGNIRLSYFIGGVETVLRELGIFNVETWIPPLPGDKWKLVAGYENEPRTFKVMRNDSVIMTVKESGTGSPLGASNRAIGFGMEAGNGSFDQAAPAAVRKISGGDNAEVSQSGFLERINAGDQPMWDRYICFGPGTFRFGNGPGSTDMVEFGPLLANQIMRVQTDPGKYGVDDLTVIPPSPQDLDDFQQGLKDFISFATANNVPPLLQAIESSFGINPPQGNPYSLLHGRWSNPIPAKSPGKIAEKFHVRVEIEGGNADSQVIASATPRRRNPY